MCYQSDFLFGVSYKAERYQDQQSPKSTTNSWTESRELAADDFLSETDMEFVQNLTPPDFQAKNFTPSISPNFNSFSKKKHKK